MHNWQGGGKDNIALNSILNYQLTYQKGKSTLLNKLDAQYGIFRPGDFKKFRKNIDQIFFLSKYSLDA
ncbi:MAG: DUF3078 domain-containing protein [Bacteroidia bacterium]|nr:DUF3078 domain-containing protein [Bacteroidia bacterium]